jgi:uncharacterized membrane-anchored protein YhcB (DUF1043 family)
MKKINRLGKKLKEITLLVVLLSMLTTAVSCVVHNSTEKRDIDSVATEDKQVKTNEPLNSEIHNLKKDLKETKREIDNRFAYQMQCNEQAINSVNTSISGATLALTIVGIILVVIGVLLGVYITLVERKVRNLTDKSKSILETHLKIKDDVEKLDSHIKRNMTQLYDDLKKEETKALVERLVKVPEDIVNLTDILTSRDIPMEFFPKLKEAYQVLPPQSGDSEVNHYRALYQVLFFQQFSATALFDKDLQSEMEMKYNILMVCSFKNDITKTTCEFLKVCRDTDILEYRDKIKKYFIALSGSKHKNLMELHKEIYKTLSTKENRFNFYSILKSEEKLKQTSKFYGQYILTDYKDASGNTESENLVLKEIAQEPEDKKTL